MHVSLQGLRKTFTTTILDDIDLELGPRQIVAIIGLNGAGKTTLLRCLAGVIAPSAGSIRWNACESIRDDLAVHRLMMFLPDSPPLVPEYTVIQHLVMMLRAYAKEAVVTDAAILDILLQLDLVEKSRSKLGELSRGQRYKAAMAAVMLIQPELWLLDEPFASGMDPQGMLALKQSARAAAASGACIVYTTQIIEIAERFCDVLLVIDRGRVTNRYSREELIVMPPEGSGSLGDRLSVFRERR